MDLILGILFTVTMLAILAFLASSPDPRDQARWNDPKNWM